MRPLPGNHSGFKPERRLRRQNTGFSRCYCSNPSPLRPPERRSCGCAIREVQAAGEWGIIFWSVYSCGSQTTSGALHLPAVHTSTGGEQQVHGKSLSAARASTAPRDDAAGLSNFREDARQIRGLTKANRKRRTACRSSRRRRERSPSLRMLCRMKELSVKVMNALFDGGPAEHRAEDQGPGQAIAGHPP